MRITDLTLPVGGASTVFKAISPQDSIDTSAQWRTGENVVSDRVTIFSNVGPAKKGTDRKSVV